MNDTQLSDLKRYKGEYNESIRLSSLLIPGFRYTYLLRLASMHSKKSIKGVIYRFLLRKCSIKYGIQIYPSTSIGKGLYIGHWGTIIVNHNATIGENCNLSSGVTIGQTNRGEKKGCPTIGNKVWIGTNAVIVGKINIGNNVMIAPNGFVNFDVPDNSIVVGNPGNIIRKENPTKGYIENIYEKQ
jgi:serine O-acetyltransferase